MSDIFDMLIAKKQEKILFTGIVSNLSPLSVKIYPGDNAILCKSTTHLTGLEVGGNVILVKIQNQFVIIAEIGAIT